MSKAETVYQGRLIQKIKEILPDCFVVKNDPAQNQGVPDLLILHRNRWAMLEVKISEHAPMQPNQPYYVEMFGEWSWASFIYPEIEEEVLSDLQLAFAGA